MRTADFDPPDTLPTAFAGVDRLLIISADTVGDRLAGQLAAVAAAKEAGVGHVFYTSAPEPTADNPAGVIPDHRATEEALAASGLRWTTLRNNLYAEFQLPTLQQAAASGQLVTNAGAGLTAYVTRTDCAAAAAAALLLPEPAQIYDITGPAGVSSQDLAALAGSLGASRSRSSTSPTTSSSPDWSRPASRAGRSAVRLLRYGDPRRVHGRRPAPPSPTSPVSSRPRWRPGR